MYVSMCMLCVLQRGRAPQRGGGDVRRGEEQRAPPSYQVHTDPAATPHTHHQLQVYCICYTHHISASDSILNLCICTGGLINKYYFAACSGKLADSKFEPTYMHCKLLLFVLK